MDKKIILLIVAAVCIGLYFYGSQIQKNNQLLKLLPLVGGLAFGLNTLVQLAQVEKSEDLTTNHQSHNHKSTQI
jgi:hypothetical protein